MKTFMLILAGFFIILSKNLFPQIVEEDILYLKSGSIIYGVVTEVSAEGNITIRSSKGKLLTFPLNEMDHVVKSNKDILESGERAAGSQTNRNTFSLGGSVYYSSVKARGKEMYWTYSGAKYTENIVDYDMTQWNMAPSVGYFVIDNLSMNFQVDFLAISRNYSEYNDLLFGVSAAYYFGTTASKPFIGMGAMLSQANESKTGAGFFFFGGQSIAIAKNLAVQLMAQYKSFPRNKENIGVMRELAFGVGFQTFIF